MIKFTISNFIIFLCIFSNRAITIDLKFESSCIRNLAEWIRIINTQTHAVWFTYNTSKFFSCLSLRSINSFVPNAPVLYPLKTSENRKVFSCFRGVEKGCIGNKLVEIVLIASTILFWKEAFQHWRGLKYQHFLQWQTVD